MIKILLVEDNEISQKMMYYTFRHAGLSSDLAADGFEAVQKATETDYDVVLMDIMMPGIDGYEATARIREFEAKTGRHTLIIGLTGNVYDSERKKCIEAGMDSYMTKPFDMEVFRIELSHYGLSID